MPGNSNLMAKNYMLMSILMFRKYAQKSCGCSLPRGKVIFQSENRNGMNSDGNEINAKDTGRRP
jgi:hypothetical protein